MPNAELCEYCTDGWLLLGTNGGGGAEDSEEVWAPRLKWPGQEFKQFRYAAAGAVQQQQAHYCVICNSFVIITAAFSISGPPIGIK